jgi:hypothetical protein
MTANKRLQGCGRIMTGAAVTLKHTPGGAAGYAGLAVCGSVWLCPVCASKVAAARSDQLASVLVKAVAAGKRVAMLTLTFKHSRGEALADLLADAQYGWHGLTSGKAWGNLKDRGGLFGWVRALEVTHGLNGFHPHYHVVVIVDEQDDDRINAWAGEVYARWSRALGRRGRKTVAEAFDCTILAPGANPEDIARYVSKLSKEATMSFAKDGRGGGRSLFQVASDALETGDAEDFAVWFEWEETMPGKRAQTWSKGLREWAELEETTDEEEAAKEHAGVPILALPRQSWRVVRHEAWVLLDLQETEGKESVTRWLDEHGLEWFEPQEDEGE